MFLPFHDTVKWYLLTSDTGTASRKIPVREFCRLEDLDLGVETARQQWMQAVEVSMLAMLLGMRVRAYPVLIRLCCIDSTMMGSFGRWVGKRLPSLFAKGI